MEYGTYTCAHCQRQIMRNPMRLRERHYCPKCDHYICDECELARVASGGLHKSFNQIADELQESASKGKLPWQKESSQLPR